MESGYRRVMTTVFLGTFLALVAPQMVSQMTLGRHEGVLKS